MNHEKFKINRWKAENWYQTYYDGRRGGIRESLEDMTMAMAHKVAELYSSVLRHSDGTSVECVIADTTIGGVAEAAMAARKIP